MTSNAFRGLKILVVFLCLPGAQGMRLTAQAKAAAPLSDYVGTYAFAPAQTVEIVAGNELFAVLDGAKYRLKRSGVDRFTTITGDALPFLRNAAVFTGGAYNVDGTPPNSIMAKIILRAAMAASAARNSPAGSR